VKASHLKLLFEIIAFCRELVKVAPASLQSHCYFSSAEATWCLQKLDEAEELTDEGLAVCRREGLEIRVSHESRQSWSHQSDVTNPFRFAG
jgi:hypothetical protein